MSELNNLGREIFDQTPVAYPFKFDRPMPLATRIRLQILQAMAEASSAKDVETIEEADDFEIDDDPEMWSSPYEQDFDHVNADLHMLSEVSKEDPVPSGDGSSGGTSQENTSQEKA